LDTRKWLESIGASIDSLDANKFVQFLTDDCVFRFGNQPEVIGKTATRDYVAAFFSMIGGCKHSVIDYWKREDSIVWQGEVLYTRKDGKKVTVNFVNILNMENESAKDYLIYIDNTPLFA
jgi:hypothetical protein